MYPLLIRKTTGDVFFVMEHDDLRRASDEWEVQVSQAVEKDAELAETVKKLEEQYDPTDKINALKRLHETARRGEFATGLIYIEPDRDDFLTQLDLVDEPLATLPLDRVRPGPEALEEIMEGLR